MNEDREVPGIGGNSPVLLTWRPRDGPPPPPLNAARESLILNLERSSDESRPTSPRRLSLSPRNRPVFLRRGLAPGFEIAHVTLHRPVPYRRGFDVIASHLEHEAEAERKPLRDRAPFAGPVHVRGLRGLQ